MAHFYPFSGTELKEGVADWKDITPQPIQKAVEALRNKFAEEVENVNFIMEGSCYQALHPVGDNASEPAIFTSYFNNCARVLSQDTRTMFRELLSISLARSTLLSREPVEWAALQMRVLIADKSPLISNWLKHTCDKQDDDLGDDLEEVFFWKSWRAPKWLFMKPFGARSYDRSTAWERMNEEETAHVLRVVEDKFNQIIVMDLDKTVDRTYIELAKLPHPMAEHTPLTPDHATKTTRRRRTVLTDAKRTRKTAIAEALAKGLKGRKYAQELDRLKLKMPAEWVVKGAPETYTAAYDDAGRWRLAIQREKSYYSAKLPKKPK